jgi:protein TonB
VRQGHDGQHRPTSASGRAAAPTRFARPGARAAARSRTVRPPQPLREPAAYVHELDYPAAALQAKQSGTVRYTLEIGPNGRVTGCTITRSSGFSWLDATTCRLMRARARFTPAVDSNGNSATARIAQHFTWKLPVPK